MKTNKVIRLSRQLLFAKSLKRFGKNNQITVLENGIERDYTYRRIPGLDIHINGDNNRIYITDKSIFRRSIIAIGTGSRVSNAEFRFGKNTSSWEIDRLKVWCTRGDNVKLTIGQDTYIGEVDIDLCETNAELRIGNGCMFSTGIFIMCSDSHQIIDAGTNEVFNRVTKPVIIGDNCWIGRNVMMTKNVHLPDWTIVGTGAVVSKKFTEQNTVLAGNPARVVKQNVYWDRRSPADIIIPQNQKPASRNH